MLQAARSWGVRPSEMLDTPRTGDGWTEADRLLAIALTLEEADRCPCGCGGYLDETTTEDGAHIVETTRCDRRAALDQYEKDNPNREPGELRYVIRDD